MGMRKLLRHAAFFLLLVAHGLPALACAICAPADGQNTFLYQLHAADAVVFNGDAGALAQGLLGASARGAVPRVGVGDRSLSALTWSMHTRASGFALVRHNVFFESDYAGEFDDIFRQRTLPRHGTVYVCAQDRQDDAQQPPGCERLLCLVNAPPDGDTRPFDVPETLACETNSLALLRQCGLMLQPQPHQVALTTPHGFNQLFPGTGGALYGRATHGWMSAGVEQPGAGAVPGGGQRAPGAGRADGSHVGAAGGRDADGAPRFDQAVAPGGYLWWYVDAISDDGQHALSIIAFVGSVFSPDVFSPDTG